MAAEQYGRVRGRKCELTTGLAVGPQWRPESLGVKAAIVFCLTVLTGSEGSRGTHSLTH